MRKFLSLTATLLLTLTFSISYAEQASNTIKKPQSNTANHPTLSGVNLLFIQTARSGVLNIIKDKPGYFTLTLSGVSP